MNRRRTFKETRREQIARSALYTLCIWFSPLIHGESATVIINFYRLNNELAKFQTIY